MSKCIVCGKEGGGWFCPACKSEVDATELCEQMIAYLSRMHQNVLWDEISASMTYPDGFRNFVSLLLEEVPSPRKEYLRMMSTAGNGANIIKAERPWLYKVYPAIVNAEPGLSTEEKNRVRGFLLGALFMDYRYVEADAVADELLREETKLAKQVYYNIADFFLKTRRYEEAGDAIARGREQCGGEDYFSREFDKLEEQKGKYQEAEQNGKKGNMPNPREGKQAAQEAYVAFLQTIGIDAAVPTAGRPLISPIPREDYPSLHITTTPNFDSFVAYDFETNGLDASRDAIIEVGAIKVINGQVQETAEFTFQEFVKPYKQSLRSYITDLTGIQKKDLANARPMWEVIPDFLDFVGDLVMIGYNNSRFDANFLIRAARYSHRIIKNPQFDVLSYAQEHKSKLPEGKGLKLEKLSQRLGVASEKSHRALDDAIATAKLYLLLKDLEQKQ